MFENTKAVASFSVNDVAAAQRFYGETLGVRVSEDSGALWLHLAGEYDALIYPKPDHIPATHTVLNFVVEDIDDTVRELRTRGVQFLRYDDFGADDQGIVRGPEREIAWFTDPAGNSVSVVQFKTAPVNQE